MPEFRRRLRAFFTRPANTTAYAANDLVANHATAGSVVALEFSAARFAGGGGRIKAVSIDKTNPVVTNAQFRVHFFALAPSVSGGDNAALAITNGLAKGYLGSTDVTLTQAVGDGSHGRAVADLMFKPTAPGLKIYALVEALAGYTPTSAEVIGVTLELERD